MPILNYSLSITGSNESLSVYILLFNFLALTGIYSYFLASSLFRADIRDLDFWVHFNLFVAKLNSSKRVNSLLQQTNYSFDSRILVGLGLALKWGLSLRNSSSSEERTTFFSGILATTYFFFRLRVFWLLIDRSCMSLFWIPNHFEFSNLLFCSACSRTF